MSAKKASPNKESMTNL